MTAMMRRGMGGRRLSSPAVRNAKPSSGSVSSSRYAPQALRLQLRSGASARWLTGGACSDCACAAGRASATPMMRVSASMDENRARDDRRMVELSTAESELSRVWRRRVRFALGEVACESG